jgi:type VI secretion system secreted protein VgrG
MAGGKDILLLELRAGPYGPSDLALWRLRGREALSEPFAFDLELSPRDGEPLDLAALVGAECAVTMRRPDVSQREVHGILWSVEMIGVAEGKPRYRARLAPRLERLRNLRRSRVFQAKSVPQIVQQVLDEAGVKHRSSLSGAHPTREYCLQYRESDLELVQRLLEEEGVFYWFEHTAQEHVLVMADAARACPRLPDPGVPIRLEQVVGATAEEHLAQVHCDRGVAVGKVALRDYDFERPLLQVAGAAQAQGDAAGLERYEYPGGFTDPGAAGTLAKVRLEEQRFPDEVFGGEGTCLPFVAGAVCEMMHHPDPAFDRKLLLVRVEHEAVQQGAAGGAGTTEHAYRNRFVGVDASRPYRPRRRARQPVAWAESATVVGPSGEEIHVDQHGRIKVRFHWDREGKSDDTASCWIRLSQAWAGPAWGASFVPRVEQEVLVRFLDGDPDRPLVVGAMFNGAHPPPVPLPDDKTRSTLRTDSSPGGGGANELYLEDRQGSEEVHLHAQKDETIEVLHDKAQKVGADEALRVKKDRSLRVDGDHDLTVGRQDRAELLGTQTCAVAGSRTAGVNLSERLQVGAARTVTVAGTRDETVALASATTVGAAAALTVGGGLATTVVGALNKAVGGALTVQVGGALLEVAGAARDDRVAKDSSSKVGGDLEIDVAEGLGVGVTGDAQEDVGGDVQLTAASHVGWAAKKGQIEADKLTIEVGGKKALVLDKSGSIEVSADFAKLEGSGDLVLKGSSIKKDAGSSSSGSSKPTPEPKKSLTCRFGVSKAKCGDEVTLLASGKNLPDGEASFKLDAQPSGGAQGTIKGKYEKSKGQARWVSRKPKGAKEIACEASAGGKKAKAKPLKMHAWADIRPDTKTIACASGRFAWTGKFEARLKDGTLVVTTRIKLLKRAGDKPDDTSRPPAAGTVDAATKTTMKADIEGKLSNKWFLHRTSCKRGAGCDCPVDAACCKIPVKVQVEFVESGQHHEVNLWTGRGRANSSNFTLVKTRPNSWAHETGHLLGWYDEYSTGAVGRAPRWIANNPSAVMNVGLTVPATYYWDFRDWLKAKAGDAWDLIAR